MRVDSCCAWDHAVTAEHKPAPTVGAMPIPKVPLGRSGLMVSRMGVGTVPIGNMIGTVSDDDAEAMLIRAHELGIQLIDTAPQYGSGLAERRVGAALGHLPRDEVVVATKVGRLLRRTTTAFKVRRVLVQAARSGPGGIRLVAHNAAGVIRRATRRDHTYPLGWPFDRGESAMEPYFDFSYDGVMRSVEGSLERLGVSRVDILYLHDPVDDYTDGFDGALRALDELRSAGTVSAIGIGMNYPGPLARFARQGDFDCLLLAGKYTLLDQSGLDELLPLCLERKITLNVGGVFNSGLLADPRPGVTYDYHPVAADSEILHRALKLQEVCARHDVPLAAAAVQFPTGHPAVGAVLIGARSASEIEEDVRLFSWPIAPALWSELREEGLIAADAPLPEPHQEG